MVSIKQKGFSIIEILLIIAILGLLLSIILVNTTTYKDKSREAATLVEVKNALNAMELCTLDRQVVFCGGAKDVHNSSDNCQGDNTAASQPTAGTALCGTTSPTGWSDSTWPDVKKNGYAYSHYAGSQRVSGTYSFSIYSDKDKDGIPDTNKAICCSQNGCTQTLELSGSFGSNCYTLSNIGTED